MQIRKLVSFAPQTSPLASRRPSFKDKCKLLDYGQNTSINTLNTYTSCLPLGYKVLFSIKWKII